MNQDSKIKILFVCLGNICRSPMAETVMKSLLEKKGVSSDFFVDSAGMINHHEGHPADSRMRHYASLRGYNITSISRPVTKRDFVEFDYIIGMDYQNMNGLNRIKPDECTAELHLMTDFCCEMKSNGVPDPYYRGGEEDFNLVIDLLEDACKGFYQSELENS